MIKQINFHTYLLTGLFLSFVTFAIDAHTAAPESCPPNPDGIASCTCDADYWESLKSHAWMTAQREISQVQNLIAKPDSVLEYTCFDLFLNLSAGESVAGLHSETALWDDPVEIRPKDSTDIALTGSVHAALASWLEGNFDHKYIGGRSNMDYRITDEVSSGGYKCAELTLAWGQAKCMNFFHKEIEGFQDGFYTYKRYRDEAENYKDVRKLPMPCSPAFRWLDMHKFSTGEETPWWTETQQEPTEHAFATTSKALKPGQCGDGKVETGVIVQETYSRPGGHNDAFCTNPGCVFNGSSCQGI